MIFILTALLGAAVGAVSALLGLGGGVFMVPLLPAITGLSILSAVATSVMTVFCVTTTNTFLFARKGLVRWPVALLLGGGSAVAAFTVSQFTVNLDPFTVKVMLLLVLGIMGLRTALVKRTQLKEFEPLTKKSAAITAFAGSGAGVVSALTGVGGGLILAPLMVIFRIVKPQELSPTSNASMMMTTAGASLGFLLSDYQNGTSFVVFPIVGGLFVAAMLASQILRPLQKKVSAELRVKVLLAIIACMMLKLLVALYI